MFSLISIVHCLIQHVLGQTLGHNYKFQVFLHDVLTDFVFIDRVLTLVSTHDLELGLGA